MNVQHTTLAQGRWSEFSLLEQLGNVGSEVSRALSWRGRDELASQKAMDRALELMDFTLNDQRWRKRLKEITRAREMMVDAMEGGKEYGSTLEDMDQYFLAFALAARVNK